MANYNLDLSGVADSTAVNTLTADDGQTHSGGPGFSTINGRMYNTTGGATDGYLDISGDFPDTFSFSLDMHLLTVGAGNMGFAFAGSADHSEFFLIAQSSGNLILYHKTASFTTLHTEAVAVTAGNDLLSIECSISPTEVSFSYDGVEVYSGTLTTNSATNKKCYWRCTSAGSSITGMHVNSISLIDPATLSTYVDGPNVLLLAANTNKTYVDGEYDVYASVVSADSTSATDSSTLTVGHSITHDASMTYGEDFVVTVSNPAVVPTDLNSTLETGSVSLIPAVTGSAPTYTLTYAIPLLPLQEGSYVWAQTVGAQTSNTSSLAYSVGADNTTAFYTPITALTGYLANDTGIVVGDENLVEILTGSFDAIDPATGTFTTNTGGTFRYNVLDVSELAWEGWATVTATVGDVTLPVITLVGSTPVTVAHGSTYNDAGATATDDTDGDITADIVPTGSVDTSTVGTYTINYNVDDAAGNSAVQVSRTVNVTDQTIPVITLTGSSTVNLTVGDTYTEQGATWTDNVDGSGAATVGGDTVDTGTANTYNITYNYQDAAGNDATEVTRTVIVSALIAPTVTTQPTAQEVTEGEDATFTVAFNNAVSIQWFDASDDSPLAGETGTSLTISAELSDDGNTYYCIATNEGLTVQTDTVSLSVNAVVIEPTPIYIYAGVLADNDIKQYGVYSENSWKASVDFTNPLSQLGGAVNSVVWSIEQGSTVTLGTAVLQSPVAQIAFASGETEGETLIKCEGYVRFWRSQRIFHYRSY